MKDFYRILGVNSSASLKDIKDRYRFLAFAYHPDRFANSVHRKIAEQEFKEINEAYSVLSCPTKRKEYDPAWQLTFQYSQVVNFPFHRTTPFSAQPGPSKTQSQWSFNYFLVLILVVILTALWWTAPGFFPTQQARAAAPIQVIHVIDSGPLPITLTPTPTFQWMTLRGYSLIPLKDCIGDSKIRAKYIGKPVCINGTVIKAGTFSGGIQEISFKNAPNLRILVDSPVPMDIYQGSCLSVQGMITQYSQKYMLSVFGGDQDTPAVFERSRQICE